MSRGQCPSVDPVSGWRCEYEAGHDGLHACARYWGTVTVPGEVIEKWQQEAEAETKDG